MELVLSHNDPCCAITIVLARPRSWCLRSRKKRVDRRIFFVTKYCSRWWHWKPPSVGQQSPSDWHFGCAEYEFGETCVGFLVCVYVRTSVGMMVNKGDKKSDQILAETSALVLANDVIVCVGTSVGMTNQACWVTRSLIRCRTQMQRSSRAQRQIRCQSSRNFSSRQWSGSTSGKSNGSCSNVEDDLGVHSALSSPRLSTHSTQISRRINLIGLIWIT